MRLTSTQLMQENTTAAGALPGPPRTLLGELAARPQYYELINFRGRFAVGGGER